MNAWNYLQPVEIIMKTGGIDELDGICASRGFTVGVLVCEPFFVKSGLAQRIVSASQGRLVAVFSEVTPNPRTTEADRCAALLREKNADFAVALGGGSTIDCAKIACALATCTEKAEAYHTGGLPLPGTAIPLIAIPTTSGTGTEVTGVSVLTDPDKGIKAPIGHKCLFPKVALIDPALTLSLPPNVTASTGLDALSHALEGFWSNAHQPICDAVALAAARLIFDYLPRAYANGSDLEAREKMSEASVLAGLAFALPKTAASHAISFPLTNIYGLPHGEACAFTLDSLCAINAKAENGRLDSFAQQLGFTDAAAMGSHISSMKKTMGMRSTLAEAGISEADLPELARLSQHPNLKNNPVSLDADALVELFREKSAN